MHADISNLIAQQNRLVQLVDTLSDDEYRRQFHDDLSPAGWHLGHAVFIEDFWLRECVLGLSTASDRHLDYLPENTPRPERGAKLPPKDDFIAACKTRQSDNIRLLKERPPKLASHSLLQNNYLVKFLVQHHAMHNETLCMTLTARQLRRHLRHRTCVILRPKPVQRRKLIYCRGASRCFGTDDAHGFDNERPRHKKRLPSFYIAQHPVTNAEFLGFMHAGGYANTRWWSPEGRRWLQAFGRRTDEAAPYHWRRNHRGHWFGIGPHAAHDLKADAPVHGVNFHEAQAFARYAGARLPSEFEWEAAAHRLIGGGAWEWCGNVFHPYPNFRPFPYTRYSQTWFDNRHYTLKGGSAHSPDPLRRRTIRNFYTAEKRHIFAGMRLALSATA